MNDDGKFDQSAAFMGDNYPPLWRRVYMGCIEVGFTHDEALSLVKAFIFALYGGKLEK